MHTAYKVVTLMEKKMLFCCLNIYLRVSILLNYALKGLRVFVYCFPIFFSCFCCKNKSDLQDKFRTQKLCNGVLYIFFKSQYVFQIFLVITICFLLFRICVSGALSSLFFSVSDDKVSRLIKVCRDLFQPNDLVVLYYLMKKFDYF